MTVDTRPEKSLSVPRWLCPAQEVYIGFVGGRVSFLYPLRGVQQKDSRYPQHGNDLAVMPAHPFSDGIRFPDSI